MAFASTLSFPNWYAFWLAHLHIGGIRVEGPRLGLVALPF